MVSFTCTSTALTICFWVIVYGVQFSLYILINFTIYCILRVYFWTVSNFEVWAVCSSCIFLLLGTGSKLFGVAFAVFIEFSV